MSGMTHMFCTFDADMKGMIEEKDLFFWVKNGNLNNRVLNYE